MNLEDYISEERLKIYESILKLKKEETIDAYSWNKALSSAMHPLMHCLEVTLRTVLTIAYVIPHLLELLRQVLRHGIGQTKTGFLTCFVTWAINNSSGRISAINSIRTGKYSIWQMVFRRIKRQPGKRRLSGRYPNVLQMLVSR